MTPTPDAASPTPAIAQTAAGRIPAARKFVWLLKREYWENKGGFLWAPMIAAAVSLLFAVIGGSAGQWMLSKSGDRTITVNGEQVALGDADFSELLRQMSTSDMQQWQEVMTALTMMSAFWPWLVLYFVVFFYLIGSLYDQRKDRSILFWKSMPVSDTQTVLSKAVTAIIIAPLITTLITAALMLAFGLMISILMLVNRINPLVYYWGQLDYFMLGSGLVAWLPVHVLWSLPTVGWLLLCSAWARSKPFLWATLIPILGGTLVSWFDLLRAIDVPSSTFWADIVARALTSALPGMHMPFDPVYAGTLVDVPGMSWDEHWFPLLTGWHLLASPRLWIGALAGVIMITATIRIMRWRDEA